MKEYKIIKNDFWNEGKLASTRYTVEEKKKILGSVYWRSVKTTVHGMTESYTAPIDFSSSKDAEDFVKSLLEGNPAEGWVRTEVKTFKENEKV